VNDRADWKRLAKNADPVLNGNMAKQKKKKKKKKKM
jgi:hypothetical protein